MISWVSGADGKSQRAESEPRVDLSRGGASLSFQNYSTGNPTSESYSYMKSDSSNFERISEV